MDLGKRDIPLWRMGAAVSWSIIFQFLFLCSYIILVNFDFWTLNLFKAPFQALFSMKSLYIFPLSAVIVFQGFIFSRDYLKPTKSQFIGKRFLILINLFSFYNFSALFTLVLLGLSVPFIYSLLNERFRSISAKCSFGETTLFDDMSCLNEDKFFLLLGGAWIGFYTFVKDYIFHSRSLTFPPIQQRKFVRVRAAFLSCLKNSFIKAVFPSLLFCLIYYFKGNTPRSYFCLISDLSLSSSTLDTVYILFHFELMIYLWIFSTIFFLTVDVMFILFNVHLTERAVFPITTFMLQKESNQCFLLRDALSCENIPIIQHLGFLDLALLSQYDSQRRAELFTLSQPGGHPHAWNGIVSECFQIIEKFTDELDKCINVTKICELDLSDKFNESKKVDAVEHSYHHHSYRNMRNLSAIPNQDFERAPVSVLYESFYRLIKVYQEWFNKKVEAFYKKPIIIYFFGEMNEPKIKHLLCQSQPVIWAVESLSFLICNSLIEDVFGVAQKDLSKIILSLLHLKNSLDKLQKQSIFIKKSNKLELVDIQMKNSLKFSVKQSIYRIAITFKNYIRDINLESDDAMTQMLNYIEFKEV